MSLPTRSGVRGLFARPEIGYRPETITIAHWVAGLLAIGTGTVHVYLWFSTGGVPFLFAGLVFYGAVVAGLLNVYRRLLYVLGVPFTAGQILIWVAADMPNLSLGLADKAVQVTLIVLLVWLYRKETQARPAT